MTLMEDVSVSVVPTGTFLSAFLAVTFGCLFGDCHHLPCEFQCILAEAWKNENNF